MAPFSAVTRLGDSKGIYFTGACHVLADVTATSIVLDYK